MKKLNRWMKVVKEEERGLTLVELLAVIVILAIVSTIATISVGNIIENSKKDAHIANAAQIINAAKLYEASGGTIAEGDTAAISVIDVLVTEGYLPSLVSPWSDQEDYGVGASVWKTSGVYHIANFDGKGCELIGSGTGVPEDHLLEEGRALCK